MAEKPEVKMARIFHTGKGHGPMHTAEGVLAPGSWLDVPEALAAKLCGAYKHVKLAADVIPGGAADPKVLRENVLLKGEVDRLSKLLADKPSDDIAALQAALRDFMEAGSKKDLDALKEKHADVLPKEPAAV